MTTHADVFLTLGLNLFRGLVAILIAWTGVSVALGAASGGAPRMDRFAGLIMCIAFTYGMLVYYSTPLPGIGVSFHRLITDQGANLAGQIEAAQLEEIFNRLSEVYVNLEQPSGPALLDVMQVIRYYGTVLMLSLAQGIVLAVIAFGFVAVAVCVLVGPIFIPFFVVPHMEWMFWGWFKALLQYAFYPVIGNAFVYVYGELLLHFFDAHRPPFSASDIAGLFLQIILMSIAFVFGLLKIPSLVGNIFGGRAGDHAFPGIGWWR
jgi:TrbL/VirB6 plasmid conjugal transfer protein